MGKFQIGNPSDFSHAKIAKFLLASQPLVAVSHTAHSLVYDRLLPLEQNKEKIYRE